SDCIRVNWASILGEKFSTLERVERAGWALPTIPLLRRCKMSGEIVGWVYRVRNPTNADRCWVSFLNPTS
ncbi:hypothetical protein, partial [Scytonema sp. NUACC21]